MYDEAIAAHKQALAIRPDLLRAHLNLGVSYDKKGELDAAIEQYRAVLALDAGYATSHTYLAIAYYKKGNYRLAIEHCDRAAALQGSVNELLLRVLAPYRNTSP
jgi:lipoprotein NlpI